MDYPTYSSQLLVGGYFVELLVDALVKKRGDVRPNGSRMNGTEALKDLVEAVVSS